MTADPSRWSSDAFLDSLRLHGDALADTCVAELHTTSDFAALFHAMTYNDTPPPPGTPQPIALFCADTNACPALELDRSSFPDGVDRARLARGEVVFLDHAGACCLVLLAKALPEGYSAPCLGEVLALSGDLEQHTYRRLLGVLQLVISVCSKGGFEANGRALVTARQARLLHAGLRRLIPPRLPNYQATYGTPVNLEDMLGTIMGFSLLVIDGLPRLGHTLSEQDADDLYYVWRVFAVARGIHPPDAPDSGEWVPATIAEAREFYRSYERRHYEPDPAKNPQGVRLAVANLQMMQEMIPRYLRFPPLTHLPRAFMTQLIGDEGCRRVGIGPLRLGFAPFRDLVFGGIRFTMACWGVLDRRDPNGTFHFTLSEMMLQGMVNRQYGGEVTFMIPENFRQTRQLVTVQDGAAH
jgi:hypothetical protein